MPSPQPQHSGNVVLGSGKFLELVSENSWEYAARRNATGVVAVLAVTPEGRLILTRQYRKAVDRDVIDLPAGLVGDVHGDPHEEFARAASRELFEETGYEAASFERLLDFPTSPGLTSEVVTLFRAQGLSKDGPGGGDESEDIGTQEIPVDEIDAWLASRLEDGLYVDPKVYLGLYLLRAARGE